jgi:hypothetical protein
MKKCIVSFADTPFYQEKMKRLEQSLKGNFDGDFLGFTSVDQIGCRPHSEIPYQFKPYAIQKAIDLGYELILWCDSPVVAIKSIQTVFDHIEKFGYLFFDNIGHPLGRWTNDRCLQHFEMSRGEAMSVRQIMACVMGFNMSCLDWVDNPVSHVFDHYKELSEYPAHLYTGSWDNHRHDQTVMSFLIDSFGLDIQTGHETYFIYEHFKSVFKIADSVCLVSK